MNYKIFLCCGAGMSSGFLAQSMRKSAKKRKVMATIEAASQSDVDSYIDDMDLLLVGPHMSYVFDELRNKAESCGKKMAVIPEEIGHVKYCVETNNCLFNGHRSISNIK